MNPNFQDYLLKITKASNSKEIEVIQSLWSGYGKIARYQLDNPTDDTVVVKHISLNQTSSHPRGWNTDRSHHRKVKSYEVETYWYEKWNQQCASNCSTPKFIGSYLEGTDQWIILEDLDVDFPLRKYELNLSEVKVCLTWLANFHAIFLHQEPIGLWEVGTYWHLATRADEYEKIINQDLKSKAHLLDDLLNKCKYKTIVHGDAKLANFCFSRDGEKVAAVDFQYVGGGCGMKDVAYFLGSCLSSAECEMYEKQLLDYYFTVFEKSLALNSTNLNFTELEQEWRIMYPIACTDFTRFLLGWMPDHQKVNAYNLKIMEEVLTGL